MIFHPSALKIAIALALSPWGALSYQQVSLEEEARRVLSEAPPQRTLQSNYPSGYALGMSDIAINADMWSDKPEILSADFGFADYIGVDGNTDFETVKAVGGSWYNATCDPANPAAKWQVLTRLVGTGGLSNAFGNPDIRGGGGYPIVFSWPIMTSTAQVTDFEVVLNDGTVMNPEGVGINPNSDMNERSTIVLVGKFSNRIHPSKEDARFPTELRIVDDGTPLMLIGPDGPVSAVGLSKITDRHSYSFGPLFITAKLNHMDDVYIGDNPGPAGGGFQTNSCRDLYPDAQYRIRLLANNGYTRDGVLPNLPGDFELFFQVATSTPVLMTKTNTEYTTPDGHTMQILGLAELGVRCNRFAPLFQICNECYLEDLDNQIDICLKGDEEAVRTISYVYTPSSEGYLPFYNPGGPGQNPFPGVTYTAPSDFIMTKVTNALDDPMTVNYCAGEWEPSLECGADTGKLVCCKDPQLVCSNVENVCVAEGFEDAPMPTPSPTKKPTDKPKRKKKPKKPNKKKPVKKVPKNKRGKKN